MFDLTNPAEQEKLSEIKSFVSCPNQGYMSFILATRDSVGNLVLHKRPRQPCYGELRKYRKTHNKEYTNPKPSDNYRPSDLRNPFPDGTPEGLGLNLAYQMIQYYEAHEVQELFKLKDDLLRFIFSEKSPWVRGIVPSSIEFVVDTQTVKCMQPGMEPEYLGYGKESVSVEHIVGVVMRHLDVDPTVMVNLFNNVRHIITNTVNLNFARKFIKDSPTTYELLGIMMTINPAFEACGFGPNDYVGYYNPFSLSWRRFTEGRAADLTGGSLKDRYDYNRKRLHEIFSTEINQDDDFPDEDPKGSISKLKAVAKQKGIQEINIGNLLEIFREAMALTEQKEKKEKKIRKTKKKAAQAVEAVEETVEAQLGIAAA